MSMRTFSFGLLIAGVVSVSGGGTATSAMASPQQAPPAVAAPRAGAMPLGAEGRPSVITNPSWIRAPRPEYPNQAFAAGVAGAATLQCRILRDGALDACRVVAEHPADMGFAASALASAEDARVPVLTHPYNPDGQVNFTIRFAAPEPEPAPPRRRWFGF